MSEAVVQAPGVTRPRLGLVIVGLVTLFLLIDAGLGVVAPQKLAAEMAGAGFPPSLGALICVTALVCAIVYAIPATRVLGAILVTGYLGGAICTHLRLGEIGSPPQLVSLVVGLLAWAGPYFQDPRVRTLLPFVKA